MPQVISISATDIEAITALVYYEADNIRNYYENTVGLSSEEAMRLAYGSIIDTILNRISLGSDTWGGDVQGVINYNDGETWQFTALPENNAGTWDELPPIPGGFGGTVEGFVEQYVTARRDGADSLVGGDTHYYNPAISSPTWGTGMAYETTVGEGSTRHKFGIPKNGDGTPGERPLPYTITYGGQTSGTINPFGDPPIPAQKPAVPGAADDELGGLDPAGPDGDGETPTDENSFMDDIIDDYLAAIDTISPLVLDLDGDGIELTNLNSAACVYWDIDADGMAEASAWVGADDGLLAIDLNEDGIINDHTELFGDQTGYANGFAALASYDLNHDWLINAEDVVWSDLVIWQDANGNGYSEETELFTLEDFDILSINTSPSTVNQTIAGNPVTLSSTYTYDTGSGTATRTIVDAWFRYSDVNTVYNQNFILDAFTTVLPSLRGYGNLPALQISMSLDNDLTDSDSLISLVYEFRDFTLTDIFNDDNSALDGVKDILFRWAGVDGVSPTSRGANIDARELEFLEKLTAQDFLQRGHSPNPYYYAAQELKEAFDIALDNFAARLIAQSAGAELFTGDFYYNIATDSFDGITGLNLTTLATLETLAGSQTAKDVFWQNVVRVIDKTIGVANLSGGDETALNSAIYDSDNSLSLTVITDLLEWDSDTVTTWNGTSGADTYTGGSGLDVLNGGASGDTLNGGASADTIYGEGGNDILDGQGGDDLIYGGGNDDTYKYTAGHGNDTFEDATTSTGDKILLASGVAVGDLTFTRIANYDLLIEIASGVGGGSIYIRDQFNTNHRIESIEFAGGGSPYNLLTQTNWTFNGTAGDDTLWGVWGAGYQDTIYGGDGDDTIYAYAANHTDNGANFLYGGDGNDTLDAYYGSGVDTLQGGAGSDTAWGGGGNDIYIYDSGHDTYNENSGTDEIQLAAGIVSGDVTYFRVSAYDLLINIDGEGSITIRNFYYSSGDRIETLRFADTSTVTLTSVTPASIKGTQGADSISGANSVNDTLYGFGGNDQLTGNSGDDTLYGGDGNDTLYGGIGHDYNEGGAGNDHMEDTNSGNDTYIYSGGLDVVYDYTGTDILRLTGATTVNDLSFTDLGNHHKITITASVDEIQLYYVDYSASYTIETMEFSDGFITNTNWKTWTIGTGSGETLNGTAGADTIVGKAGNDTLNGSDGADAMHGGADNDTLDGGNGADLLHGGSGDDIIGGGDGLDTLYGGDGLDTFLFDLSAYNNIDNVKDFSIAQNDALDIANILTGFDQGVDDITEWVSFTNSSGNSQMFVDRDGTGGTYSAQQVALLYGVVDLNADDLLGTGNLIAA